MSMKVGTVDNYISISEAAKRLNCGVGTLRQRARRGKLKIHMVVGRQAISLRQLQELQANPPVKRKKKVSHK